jgi:hypothetical protein
MRSTRSTTATEKQPRARSEPWPVSSARSADPSMNRAEEFAAEADALEAHAHGLVMDDPKLWRKRMYQEEWQHTRGRRAGRERDNKPGDGNDRER